MRLIGELGFDLDIVNVNGGAFSLGHSMGATGGVMISMMVDELKRRNKITGLIAICGAAGSGNAILVKAC